MFSQEMIQSFFFIGVITAGIVWCGVAFGRRENGNAIHKTGRDSHRKTA
jgi:hypothetical protein